MEEDMTNFLRFRMVGGNLQAKSNVVPHIFDCQHQRSILKYVPRTATLKQNATRYLPAILESFSNSPRVTIEAEDAESQEPPMCYGPDNDEPVSEDVAVPLPLTRDVGAQAMVSYRSKGTHCHPAQLGYLVETQTSPIKNVTCDAQLSPIKTFGDKRPRLHVEDIFTDSDSSSEETSAGCSSWPTGRRHPNRPNKESTDESADEEFRGSSTEASSNMEIIEKTLDMKREDMDKLMQSSYSAAINLAGSRSLIKQEPGENQEAQPDVGFVDMGSEPLKLSQVLEEDMDPLMLPGTFQTPNTVSQDLPCLPGPHCFKQEVLDDMKQEPPEMMQAGSTTSHGPLNADEDDYQMSILPEARSLNQDVEFHVKEEQTCLVDAREICSAELRNHPGSFFSSGKYGADSKSSVEGHKSTECDVDCAISHPPIDYVKNPSIKNVSTRAQSENEPSLGNPQPVCGEQEIYACDSCDSTFSGNDALVKHKTIDCDASVVGFTRTQHKRFNSGEKPFTCDTCDAKFSQSSDLRRHTRCHSGDRPFACDICQARFAQSSHLTAHSRSHSGDRPYACDLCSARFTQGSNLRRHQQSHSGEKPHACDICEARFTRSSHLAEHKRFHSGDKPYACDSCSARYTQKYYLTRHQKSHLEEKTHACDMCAARFAQNSNLVRHKRCHLGETSFVCHICQARFAKSAHLTRHKRSHFPKAKSHS